MKKIGGNYKKKIEILSHQFHEIWKALHIKKNFMKPISRKNRYVE